MNHAIFLVFDDAYCQPAIACLKSIEANYPGHPRILACYDGNDDAVLAFLASVRNLERVPYEPDDARLEGISLGVVNSPKVFYRYRLWSERFDAYDDILHLDVDTLVLKPLDALFGRDAFFAVSDHSNPGYRVLRSEARHDPQLVQRLAEDQLFFPDGQDEMINAGVFVIPKRYRNRAQYEKLWELTRRYNDYLLFADQSAISLWCHYNQIPIATDYRFNFQAWFFYSDAFFYDGFFGPGFSVDDIHLLHFSSWKHHGAYYQHFAALAGGFLRLGEKVAAFYPQPGGKYDLSSLSVILSVKIETADRLHNLGLLLDYFEAYFTGYEIVLVEQGPVSRLDDWLAGRPNVFHCLVPTGSCHYKTRNLNLATRLSTRPYVMMCDCDVFCKPEAIVAALQRVKAGVTCVSPYNGLVVQVKKHLFAAGPEMTRLVAALPYYPKDFNLRLHEYDYTDTEPLYGNSNYDNTGGCLVYNKRDVEMAGGWNENFVSYGFEDMEFLYRLRKLGYSYEKTAGFNLYHLEHERLVDSMYNNFYRTNEEEWNHVGSMSPEALQTYALNGFRHLQFDPGQCIQVRNTREGYSVQQVHTGKPDLPDLSIIVPLLTPSAVYGQHIDAFLNYLEQHNNGYEVILVEAGARDYKYLKNHKNVKYCWYGTETTDLATLAEKGARETNRQSLLVCDLTVPVDTTAFEAALQGQGGPPNQYVYPYVKRFNAHELTSQPQLQP